MYVLDTNAISELRKHERANRGLLAWADAVPETLFFLSAITIFEIELGTTRMERRDNQQGRTLRNWLDAVVLVNFGGRILPVDAAVAARAARLHVPDPRPERDALIAATALVHGMTIVTRNVADFAPTGVSVFNPWR